MRLALVALAVLVLAGCSNENRAATTQAAAVTVPQPAPFPWYGKRYRHTSALPSRCARRISARASRRARTLRPPSRCPFSSWKLSSG